MKNSNINEGRKKAYTAIVADLKQQNLKNVTYYRELYHTFVPGVIFDKLVSYYKKNKKAFAYDTFNNLIIDCRKTPKHGTKEIATNPTYNTENDYDESIEISFDVDEMFKMICGFRTTVNHLSDMLTVLEEIAEEYTTKK